MRVAVTGANGHLGRRLLGDLVAAGHEPVAIVRSESAAARISPALGATIHIASYADADSLAEGLANCEACVHLVGIIRETPATTFEAAHVEATRALLAAAHAAAVSHIIYYSLLGADVSARNPCLATRGEAERLFAESGIATTVLRVGMVLGQDDYAAAALGKRARRATNLVLRGSSLEQPLYAGDLTAGTVRALSAPAAGVYDIAGPESLPRSALIQRAARALGGSTRIISLPVSPVLLVAD